MGASCNPKPQQSVPPTSNSLELCCKRLKYHLQIKQNKINQEIIATEPQLVRRITASNTSERNKFEQLLIAQRVVNGLKYTAVYTLLMQYSNSLQSFASFICQNANNPTKLQPFQHKLYSIMYAGEKMPLSTLLQFRKCMDYFNDPILTEQYADQQIKKYLTPHPTPEEMNVYMMEMAQRNNLTIDKINLAGHQFGPNFKPKAWDHQFKAKSNMFRDSLPKQMVGTNNHNNTNQHQNVANIPSRSSISNPFDKGKIVDPKSNDPNADKQIGSNNNDNLDSNDISPNITDVMKKIGKSHGP